MAAFSPCSSLAHRSCRSSSTWLACGGFSLASTTYSLVSHRTPPLSSLTHATRLRGGLLSVDGGLAAAAAAAARTRSTGDDGLLPPPPSGGTMIVGWLAGGVGAVRGAWTTTTGCMGRRGFMWSGFREALRGTAALSAESRELSSSIDEIETAGLCRGQKAGRLSLGPADAPGAWCRARACLRLANQPLRRRWHPGHTGLAFVFDRAACRLALTSATSGRVRLAGAAMAAVVRAFHRSSRPLVSAMTAWSSLFSADLRSLLTTWCGQVRVRGWGGEAQGEAEAEAEAETQGEAEA
jgi:hypothetical protein